MSRAGKFLLILIAALALWPLSGFAQSPTPAQSIYGAYPASYQEIVTVWLDAQSIDPKSVKVKWLGEPKPAELPAGDGQKIAGYLVEFTMNARNVFGAYTGAQKHGALIRDGQVVRVTGFVYR